LHYFTECGNGEPPIFFVRRGKGEMQSELLQTMTARYIPREDRIALDCVIHDGRELRLMFTHRLARAVVAEFARQLSDGGRGALAQDFAQFEAVSGKPDAQPVESLNAEGAWLVTHLHIQSIENVQRLIFTEDDNRGVHLDCTDAILRNLLDIFYKAFALGDWDLSVFPSWVLGDVAGNVPTSSLN
jgi:hypothetical protein